MIDDLYIYIIQLLKVNSLHELSKTVFFITCGVMCHPTNMTLDAIAKMNSFKAT